MSTQMSYFVDSCLYAIYSDKTSKYIKIYSYRFQSQSVLECVSACEYKLFFFFNPLHLQKHSLMVNMHKMKKPQVYAITSFVTVGVNADCKVNAYYCFNSPLTRKPEVRILAF